MPSQQALARRPRTPPTRLSLDVVVQTALDLLDREGLGAVTTRRVAQELGTGAASLYAHVRDKDDLLAHVLEKVLADMPLPTARGTWQQRVVRYARQTRKHLLAHPGLAAIALSTPACGPGALRRLEWLVALLRGAGLDDRAVVAAVDAISLLVVASAHEEELAGQAAPDHWARHVGASEDLPESAYPHSVALAPTALACSPQERFEVGVRLIVRGLEDQLAQD